MHLCPELSHDAQQRDRTVRKAPRASAVLETSCFGLEIREEMPSSCQKRGLEIRRYEDEKAYHSHKKVAYS